MASVAGPAGPEAGVFMDFGAADGRADVEAVLVLGDLLQFRDGLDVDHDLGLPQPRRHLHDEISATGKHMCRTGRVGEMFHGLIDRSCRDILHIMRLFCFKMIVKGDSSPLRGLPAPMPRISPRPQAHAPEDDLHGLRRRACRP